MPTTSDIPANRPSADAAAAAPLSPAGNSINQEQVALLAEVAAVVANSSIDDDDDDGDDKSTTNNSAIDLLSSSSSPSTLPTNDNNDGVDGNNKEDEDDDNTGDDEHEEENIAIGTLTTKLDPNAAHCWSCLVNLRRCDDTRSISAQRAKSPSTATTAGGNGTGTGFLYTTHEHPLLNIMVCSVCEERAEAVESDVIDVELDNNQNPNNNSSSLLSNNTNNNEDVNACSWCGLADDDLAENDTTDSIPCSDLLLCDNCPRSFCVRCVLISLGGDVAAWETVKEIIQGEMENEKWLCCKCSPTDYLRQLQCVYDKMVSSTSPSPTTKDDEEEDAVMMEEGEGTRETSGDSKELTTEHDDNEEYIQKLLEELDSAENSLDDAASKLTHSHLNHQRERIESELIANDGTSSLEDVECETIEHELESYVKQWQIHFDQLTDTICRLQDELETHEGGVMEAFYKCREKEKGERSNGDLVEEDYKVLAERALEKRDAEEGFARGEFRGASGYKPQDPRVLMLEPEDLPDSCLNEIEDVNTMEGAIEQMQSNARKDMSNNAFRSNTGTTDMDIEMFRKKAVKFEEVNLGDKIDLDLLEKRCVTDKDDAAATKKEGSMVVRRKGNVRVVRRSESLRAFKKQARKDTTKARLSGEKQEYQPKMPPKTDDQPPPVVPRIKKRAQLQPLSTRMSGGYSSRSSQLSPCMRGLLIGNDLAAYEDSSIVLEVEGCSRPVTVCKPLAVLLKEHQVEGLSFCWKNVCSKLMSFKQESEEAIHGAILAHNMGLGKSLQAVCLLHTLLTNPLLVTPSAGVGSGSGGRVVFRALLLAPVNTLANWQTEFTKWIGQESGRNLPAVRFYPWPNNIKDKTKVIKEWYEYGGILCVSSERYANATKGFLEKKKSTKKSTDPVEEKVKSAAKIEEDAFLRKALFEPGPDIVVLDEIHSMLKTKNTNIYKVLLGMKTRRRLGLTGSPIQNNLYEYFQMASWMRPGVLGSEASFTRKFYDPILNGMASDCTPFQAEKQEEATKEMHSILETFVHRRDANVLAKELPFLQETIIHVRQSKAQTKLYREFRKYQREMGDKGFFKQYHAMRPVTNHPATLMCSEEKKSRPNTPTNSDGSDGQKDAAAAVKASENQNQPRVAPESYAWICDICQKAKFPTLDEAEEHEANCDGTFDPDALTICQPVATKKDLVKKYSDSNEKWYDSFAERAEKSGLNIKDINHGGKIVLLLQIIAHCNLIEDKVVVFSQSLATLSFIEEILNSPDWGGFKFYLPDNIRKQKLGGWRRNQEYLRIDGSVDAKERGDLIDTFHSTAENQKSKLFLLSTNAGGLGINLIAANRVVLFDSHWNPAVDLQAVYRCYRYGQTKPTFCYRLLAEGTMEQKIYSRAATKTSLSDLVIDEKNPERSFSSHEMDLLRVEDTWVGCHACGKWRMLPPDICADVVEELPDEWYCKDNIYDPSRASCQAPEKEGLWMVKFYQQRARLEEGEDYGGQSQSSQSSQAQLQSSQGMVATATVACPAFEQKHQLYTERDEVLQKLLERSEEKKTTSSTGKDTSTSNMRWVSKWDFNFNAAHDEDKEKEEETEEKEAEPKKKSPKKATKQSPPKSPAKSRSSKKKSAKKSKVKSEDKNARRSPRKSSKKRKPSPRKSTRKKRKSSSPESEANDESKPKSKEAGVVDLTFSDSD